MRQRFALALCAVLLTGCQGPPIWQAYPNYLYGPGTWVPGYYGYGGYWVTGPYDYRTTVPNPAGPPPAAKHPTKVRTVMVRRGYQNCSMDVYSDGVVSAVYNCSWQNETPTGPTS